MDFFFDLSLTPALPFLLDDEEEARGDTNLEMEFLPRADPFFTFGVLVLFYIQFNSVSIRERNSKQDISSIRALQSI